MDGFENTSDRDIGAEFDAFVEASLPDTDWVAAIVAAEIVGKLRANDPALLSEWLAERATVIVTDYIGAQQRSRRAATGRTRASADFAEAASRFSSGDQAAMSAFKATLVVNDENLHRAVGDMTKADHLFVASQHVKRSESALFEAAFHRAVAKRVPTGKTTKDVLSEDAYLKMRDSIRPRNTAAKAVA